MLLAVVLLAGCSLALPTPESEEKDGAVSRKILGSSVVTSVSVIMDVGNGSQTYFSDAVGKPMTKPSAATQLASPINLLNPDRYEFYTFNDDGDLVKRLMTLDEIQGIIASGDGEASNYNSQSLTGNEPEKRVDDVVNNVQNVLKEEMEAHKTSDAKPTFDTPDVTSTWSMILPAIFGNSGEDIVPEKQQNAATAETIMIEPTTLLPLMNDSNVRTESEDSKQTPSSFTVTIPDVTTEVTSKEVSNENSQTESSSEAMDTPVITVEITSQNSTDEIMHDEAPADSKTESSYISEIQSTTSDFRDTQTALYNDTGSVRVTATFTSRPVIIISTPSPFTAKVETPLPPSTAAPLSSVLKISSTSSYITTRPSLATTSKASPSTASPSTTPRTSSLTTPTAAPLTRLTAATSTRPTAAPSTRSTATPSTRPTAAPSTRSTAAPLTRPTGASSTRPTAAPSTRSTAAPSTRPTGAPSTRPTAAPSTRPTASPSTTPLAPRSTAASPTISPSTISASPATSFQVQNEITTPHGQLSTFFLVEDYKHRPEISTPAPFSSAKLATKKHSFNKKTESTTKIYFRPLPFISTNSELKAASTEKYFKRTTELYSPTTEDIAKENNKGYLDLDNISSSSTQKPSSTQRTTNLVTETYTTPELSSTDNRIFSSTEELTTATTKPYLQTSSEEILNDNEENLRFSTSKDDLLQQSTTENLSEPTINDKQTQPTELPTVEESSEAEFTKLITKPTTERNNDMEKQAVTELLNQLLITTNVYQVNPQLLLGDATTVGNNPATSETFTAADNISTTEQSSIPTLSIITKEPPNTTLKLENESLATTEANLVSSIEQLISQAIGNPDQSIENIKEGEKINQVIQNTNSKPMSEVQIETATAASALIGTPNSEAPFNVTLGDDEVNQAVDSLISQVIYHQPIQTTEGFSTTDSIQKYTEHTTVLNTNDSSNAFDISTEDDRNRYEELDLENLDSSTTSNSESKTGLPILLLSNENEPDGYTTEISEKTTSIENQITEQSISDKATSTELNQEETKYQSTLYSETHGTTEKLVQDYSLTTTQKYNEESSKPTYKFPSVIDLSLEVNQQNISNVTNEDISTSTESLEDATSKSNEILKSEASELNQENYNRTIENSSEPFLIITSSSEYPDYASTEIVDVFTKNVGYDSTTSGEINDSTEIFTAAVTHPQLSTQNLPAVTNNADETGTPTYQTTEGNLVTELKTQTTQGNFQTNYETTEINLLSGPIKQTTIEYFSSTELPTEKTNFPTTQQPIITSRTQKPFVSTTQQPLTDSTTNQPITISTVRQPLTVLTTQQPIIVSTTQPSTLSTTQQQVGASSTTQPITASTTVSASTTSSSTTPAFVNLRTVTVAPKIENGKPAELKLIQNSTSSTTTAKPDMTWTLVSTVIPHKTTFNDESKTPPPNRQEASSVDLVPKPLQGFGLEDSTSTLDTDVFQFTELCNELAFSFWSSVTSGISFARSVVVSPFAATSMLAMVFLGARGSTSGEMNEILKLDDMVTFNPHSIFKNVIESIEVSKKSGVAVSVFVKELYSDKNKGKLLSFYKERVKQFYDGHVEEANFKEINDVIRRRTNLLVKRQTWGKIPEYLKDNNLFARPPLAAVSANIFETDCSDASTEGRDGELHFVVLPSIRQRKLVPIPAVVWRSGFLAGYDPGLDATAVAVGTKDQTISTIFVIPGQQGISAPGDGLMRLEARLIESAFRQGAWSRLLRSLIPRPGLEVQIPRFSHKSVINATMALQRMGLKDLFNSNTADLKGLNGVAHELFLSDIVQVNTFATCGEGRIDETHHSEVYPATTNRSFRRIRKIQHYHSDKPLENSDILEEPRDYQRAFHDPLYDPSYLSLPLQLRPRQARLPDAPRLRFDRPFVYFVRHNPTGIILHMGRFNPRLLP